MNTGNSSINTSHSFYQVCTMPWTQSASTCRKLREKAPAISGISLMFTLHFCVL